MAIYFFRRMLQPLQTLNKCVILKFQTLGRVSEIRACYTMVLFIFLQERVTETATLNYGLFMRVTCPKFGHSALSSDILL